MALKITNLHKSFGEKTIFGDFSLELPDMGAFALVGESGAGKTTLLRMISGLDSEFSGEISGGGIKNTAFVFQEHRLFPTLSAIDNIIFANHDKKTPENEREAKNILTYLGFSEADMQLLPSELSGGMKQRVAFARGTLRPAPILLLDEPTKELDRENTDKLLELIKIESKKRLVLFVSHSESDIDRIGAKKIKINL